jgi:hypothetical protein
MRTVSVHVLCGIACLGSALLPELSVAQEAAPASVPCHDRACALVFDWGSGQTSVSYPPDRRYGSGDDFENRVRSALADHGFHTKDAPANGPLVITLRPTMRPRSMCDMMPGTGTDMSCTAMSDVTVTFASNDPAVKAPNALRVTNRCGSGNTFTAMSEFGQYSGDMVYYTLEGAQKKETRPALRC